MALSYLTFAQYRATTTIPSSLVDDCVNRGKDITLWLEEKSSWINARLAVRYGDAVDFQNPGPAAPILRNWLKGFVDLEVWKALGGNPAGRVDGWYEADKKAIEAEVLEAADSKEGKFRLPLRATDPLGSNAINQAAPLGYSEPDAYTWTDRQYEQVRNGI